MSARASSRNTTRILPLLALAGAFAAAAPAAAVDPVIDPMRPNEGPTATAPRQAEREMRRDLEKSGKTPTLTERFGLPPVSGPLLPLLPPRQEPVLLDPRPAVLPPPPQPRPLRARQPRDRDG